MKPHNCKYCDSDQHTSLMCFAKPRKAMRSEAEKAKSKRTNISRVWFEQNPPDAKGIWGCYLQIHPNCPVKLTRSTIRLEHVKSKARHPELKYDINNLRPACDPCNKMKGSRDYEEL